MNPKLPPWKRPRKPGSTPAKLTAAQVDAARARAAAAGRRYPNLVDNMWAARQPPSGKAAGPRTNVGLPPFRPLG